MHKEPIYFQKLALELFQLRILSFHFQRPGLHTRKEPRKREKERERANKMDREKERDREREKERGSSERSAIIPQRFPRVRTRRARRVSRRTVYRVCCLMVEGNVIQRRAMDGHYCTAYPGRAERSQPPGYGLVLSLRTGLVPRSMQRVTQPCEQRQLS